MVWILNTWYVGVEEILVSDDEDLPMKFVVVFWISA